MASEPACELAILIDLLQSAGIEAPVTRPTVVTSILPLLRLNLVEGGPAAFR
jgi:hypothetical protein